MLKLAAAFFVTSLALAMQGPPVPPGTVEADVPISYPVKLLASCLGDVEAKAHVKLIVTNVADGDDKQYYILSVESGAHEDSVACIYDAIVEWSGT